MFFRLLFLNESVILAVKASTPEDGFNFGYQVTKEQILQIAQNAPDWVNYDPIIGANDPCGSQGPCTIEYGPSPAGLASYIVTTLYQNGTAQFFESKRESSPYWQDAYAGFQTAIAYFSLGLL